MKNYTLKLYKNSGKVEIIRTRKKKRFLRIIRTINWQNGEIKRAYLKVSYGKKICNYECPCEFFNETYCNSNKELLEMFRYFDDED
jgi:hypothetical protein